MHRDERTPRPRARTAAHLGVALALTAALAVASSWPLAARLDDDAIALGTEEVATVPMASAWALWWTADRLGHGLAGYWDAPIFAPVPDSFAMSEPMPLLGVVAAPIFWLGGGAATALGVIALLALVTNGLAVGWLARRVGLGRGLALASAAGGALLPFAHHELGVLTLVPLGFVVLAIGAGLGLVERPGWRGGLALGAALGASYLVCGQMAIFAALAIGPAVLVCSGRRARGAPSAIDPEAAVAGSGAPPRPRPTLRALGALALAAVVLGAIAAPVGLAQRRAAATQRFERRPERVENGSASAQTWWRSGGIRVVPQPLVDDADPPGQRALFPGYLKLLLAAVAVAWAWRRPAWRAAALYLTVVAACAVAWSMAPRLGVFGPYGLIRWLPGISEIRSFWRAGALAQIAAVILAAIAIHAARDHAWPARLRGRARGAVCAALAVLAMIELWPHPARLAPTPGAEWDGVIAAVRGEVPPGAAVAHLPFAAGTGVAALETDARAMMLAIRHGHPIANGYSSFFPRPYRALVTTSRGFPGPVAFAALERAGVRALVVDTARLRHPLDGALPPAWAEVHRDDRLGVVVLARRADAAARAP